MKFILNRNGVKELLRGVEMQNILKGEADLIKNKLSNQEGYSIDLYVGKNRANASIKANSDEAINDCLKHNTLVKALYSGQE